MKVLQINTTLNWGSTGRIAEEIGLYILKNNGKSCIVYGRNSNPSQSSSIKVGNKLDFYWHALQTRLFDRHGLESNFNTYKIISLIKETKPDIIHLHNLHGYYLNYSILFMFLSKQNIPIVWTLHDCWAYTGHCSHYSYVKCDRWKTICYDCRQKNAYPRSFLLDRSKKNFLDKKKSFTSISNMTIVPVSHWLAGEVKNSFLKKYPIKVIHNGIDTHQFYPYIISKQEIGLDNKYLILGVASVWNNRKGLNDFISLRKLLPSIYSIVLIGLSKEQIKNLPKGIIGIQRTNNIQELAQYYSVADVYVNFSVEETFGMTTCESLACGTPVIVYNSTACPEIVSNDIGFVVEPGDLKTVADKIKLIISKGKNVYTEICRQNAIENYDKEKIYKEYFQLYNNLLGINK